MHSTWQLALASWSIPWVATVALGLTAVVYLRGWYLLRCAGFPALPLWRALSFLSGLAAVWVALAGPMDVFNGWLLTAHMLQHMLLMMVAPPLLLLGSPMIPLVRGLPVFAAREFAGPFLNWRVAQRVGRALTHPVAALLLMGAVMLGWHIPRFYELALQSETWHEVEHASFLIASLIYWWPVIQPWPSHARWPRWAMVPYLVVADVQNTILSATLVFSDRVLYGSYNAAPRVFGFSAHEDQAAAGAIMWVLGSVAFLVPAMVIAVECLTQRASPAGAQRLRKRAPVLSGAWLRMLRGIGLAGTKAEAVSFAVLYFAAAIVFCAALARTTPAEDLDLIARQDAGDLSVAVYGPGHTATTGRTTFGVLVHSETSVASDLKVEASASQQSSDGRVVTGTRAEVANRLLKAVAMELPSAGAWLIRIKESDSSQSASLVIPVQVVKPAAGLFRWWPYSLAPLLAVGLLVIYAVRHRGSRAGRELPRATAAEDGENRLPHLL